MQTLKQPLVSLPRRFGRLGAVALFSLALIGLFLQKRYYDNSQVRQSQGKDSGFDVKSPNQLDRGYESMITQFAKPLGCPKHSSWRGPFERSDSVEARLDDALAKRQSWASNTLKAVESCGNGPLLTPEEFGLMFHLLRKGDLMLEWGAGKSSCIWAQVVGELHSVDDSSEWVNLLTPSLAKNQVVHWMPSFKAAKYERPMTSLDEYVLYVNIPLLIAPTCIPKYNNVKFDVISIDGRVRPQCAYQALLLLKRDGVLLMHDFETTIAYMRPHYRIILRWYELLHLETSLAVFRIKPSLSGPEHYAQPGEFPSWWTKSPSIEEFDISDINKVPYEEPFEKPQQRSKNFALIKAEWTKLRAQADFRRTDDLFTPAGDSKTETLRSTDNNS